MRLSWNLNIFLRYLYATIILAAASLFFGVGCRVSPKDPDTYPSTVQVINALQDSNGIQASVDKNRVARTVKFNQSTGLYGIQPGSYALNVDAIGGLDIQPRAILRDGDFQVDENKHYTAVAFGAPGSIRVPASLAIFTDDKLSPDTKQDLLKRGVADISVFNAAVSSGKVDVTVSSIVTFKAIEFGHRSTTIELAAQPYEWGVAAAGSNEEAYGAPITLPLQAGKHYLLVITGNVKSGDITITPFAD